MFKKESTKGLVIGIIAYFAISTVFDLMNMDKTVSTIVGALIMLLVIGAFHYFKSKSDKDIRTRTKNRK